MSSYPVKILVTGDFCPINRVEKLVLNGDYKSVFNDFIDVFKGNNLNIVDLECPLTQSITARPKSGPHQKAQPESVNVLKYAGVNLVAMANNHIMDYGTAGVEDTLELCHSNNIATVGIGKTQADASIPYIVDINGKQIAIFNIADNEFLSTPDGSYTCNPIDAVKLNYDILDARKVNDFIIVLVHAGNEFYELPSPRTKRLYRFIIDSGADAVISHHTHVYSGYEIYKGKPVFYGLGNFIYDWPGKIHENWNMGYVVRLCISEKVSFEIIPLTQCTDEPGVFHLSNKETEAFYKKLNHLNKIILDDEQLEARFHEYCKTVYPMYDAFIEPYFGKYITALQKRKFLPKLLSRRKRLLLLNLTRCDSHRDVVISMLKQYE